MSEELEEAIEWIKERLAYIAENCDLQDADNKKVYNNFKTVLNYIDNSIPIEVVEKKIEELKNMKVELPVEHMKQAQIQILQELLEVQNEQ